MAPLGFQFLDFQIKSFVDPKPVELGESYIPLKFAPSLLVWLHKWNWEYLYTEGQYIQSPMLGVNSTPNLGDWIYWPSVYRYSQFYLCNQTMRLGANYRVIYTKGLSFRNDRLFMLWNQQLSTWFFTMLGCCTSLGAWY